MDHSQSILKSRFEHRLPNGDIERRVSAHPYTHVVVGMWPDKQIMAVMRWSATAVLAQRAAAQFRRQGALEVVVEPINEGTRFVGSEIHHE